MSMSVSEGSVLTVASPLPATVAGLPPKASGEILLEGRLPARAPVHAVRPDHEAMLRRVRAQ